MAEEEQVTDMLGNTYKVGDHVVYGTVSSKCPVLKYAIVEKIIAEIRERPSGYEDVYRADGSAWRRPTYENYTYMRVGVREISNGRGFRRFDTELHGTGEDRYKVIGTKPPRITYPMTENIVKAISNQDH